MKKIICLFAVLSAMIMTSCDDDDNTAPEKSKLYEIQIDNRLTTEYVGDKCDANLYDVCLVSMNGEVYPLGTVKSMRANLYTLPNTHKDEDVMVLALKIGKSESEARNSYYLCLEGTKGKVKPIYVLDDELTMITIYYNNTWSQMKYKTMDELKEFAKSIATSGTN